MTLTTAASTSERSTAWELPKGSADAWVGARPFVLLSALFAAVWWAWTVRGTKSCPGWEGRAGAGATCTRRDGCEEGAGLQERDAGPRMSELSGAPAVWARGPVSSLSSSAKEVPCVLGGRADGVRPEC